MCRFSPRNGEVILKFRLTNEAIEVLLFQSPQWGSNSKVYYAKFKIGKSGFSPRNGEVILKVRGGRVWKNVLVSVPAMGK